jgi:hypothetical protein
MRGVNQNLDSASRHIIPPSYEPRSCHLDALRDQSCKVNLEQGVWQASVGRQCKIDLRLKG